MPTMLCKQKGRIHQMCLFIHTGKERIRGWHISHIKGTVGRRGRVRGGGEGGCCHFAGKRGQGRSLSKHTEGNFLVADTIYLRESQVATDEKEGGGREKKTVK